MTHRFGVAHDPVVVARWCALAEQRLDYLTELFNNGRWRRYYSHAAFLENIKEAKAMVAHWRALSTPGYVPEPRTAILIPDLKPAAVPDVVAVALAQEMPHKEVLDKEMPDKMPSPPDLMQDRYSLLRNLTQ